jgi:transcriptional regulator with GAF, ATPase, and Fis domain
MTNQEKKQLGTERPSKQKDREAPMEVHQMDIQRVLSISLSSTGNLLEGLNLCLEGCLQISGMDCGGIYLFDNMAENLKLIVHSGFKDDFVNGISSYDKTSNNVIMVKRGKPLYTLISELDVSLTKKQHREGLRAFSSIPLFDNSNVIGCINVASHINYEIPISSRIALETVAAQVGNVIARLQATKALKESEKHLISKTKKLEEINTALNVLLLTFNYLYYKQRPACEISWQVLQLMFHGTGVTRIFRFRP